VWTTRRRNAHGQSCLRPHTHTFTHQRGTYLSMRTVSLQKHTLHMGLACICDLCWLVAVCAGLAWPGPVTVTGCPCLYKSCESCAWTLPDLKCFPNCDTMCTWPRKWLKTVTCCPTPSMHFTALTEEHKTSYILNPYAHAGCNHALRLSCRIRTTRTLQNASPCILGIMRLVE
jgi:hypothetical protein